jgi:tRNA pseudouridine32 synthase / 23S rRNA pseudouridine746 synthase
MANPPTTVLEHLLSRFPHIHASIWRGRISQGLVTLSDGTTLYEDSPYRHGITVFYKKQVPSEPLALEEPVVVYRDEEIMVVDKPHGMPVTPAGEYIERSLLAVLQRGSDLPDLSPMHRLDTATAGLVLLTIKPAARAPYHRLFSDGMIEREYTATAHVTVPPEQRQWRLENRLAQGEPWYRQRIVEGAANAVTEIALVDYRDGIGRFRLLPKSGKKHQLRVHMASIGFPIVGDPLYPVIRRDRERSLSLQLLAFRLAFIDPLAGASREFVSARKLSSIDYVLSESVKNGW